ncbi:MAG: VOC family protein [Propionibacteriaceae bacterium]
MGVNFQLCIDCADPDRLAHFWAAALGYVLEPPPAGFDDWDSYWRQVGVPEEELGIGADLIVDPDGHGPRIMFHVVPEVKSIKNRLHLDIHASGGRTTPIEDRKRAVDAEAQRLVALGASIVAVNQPEGVDHYAVNLRDPEGNEFDIN